MGFALYPLRLASTSYQDLWYEPMVSSGLSLLGAPTSIYRTNSVVHTA